VTKNGSDTCIRRERKKKKTKKKKQKKEQKRKKVSTFIQATKNIGEHQ